MVIFHRHVRCFFGISGIGNMFERPGIYWNLWNRLEFIEAYDVFLESTGWLQESTHWVHPITWQTCPCPVPTAVGSQHKRVLRFHGWATKCGDEHLVWIKYPGSSTLWLGHRNSWSARETWWFSIGSHYEWWFSIVFPLNMVIFHSCVNVYQRVCCDLLVFCHRCFSIGIKPKRVWFFRDFQARETNLVCGLEHFLSFHILGRIIPIDKYFSEGLNPPTSNTI